MPVAVKSLDHIVLTVKDIQATVDFYTKHLGMKHEAFSSPKDMSVQRSVPISSSMSSPSSFCLFPMPWTIPYMSSPLSSVLEPRNKDRALVSITQTEARSKDKMRGSCLCCLLKMLCLCVLPYLPYATYPMLPYASSSYPMLLYPTHATHSSKTFCTLNGPAQCNELTFDLIFT